MGDMVIIGNARYRVEDATRLGLVTKGTVVTARSVKSEKVTTAPAGLVTTETASVAAPVVDKSTSEESTGEKSTSEAERPQGGNATKAAWVEYALAHGKTEEELDGLKRDEIAALFPAGE